MLRCVSGCACPVGIEFDLESFKLQLQRLAMPHQQFSFSQVSAHFCFSCFGFQRSLPA